MTMAEGNTYKEVSLRPNWRQLLIDEGLSILGGLALLVAGGLDAVPYRSVLLGLVCCSRSRSVTPCSS